MKGNLILLVLLLGGAAHAQLPAPRIDAAEPTAPAVPLRFETGLEGKPAAAAEPVDPAQHWRAHNDRVREIGGHVGHLRGRHGTASAPAPAPRQDKP